LRINAKFNGINVVALIDSGTNSNFISDQVQGLKTCKRNSLVEVEIASGDKKICDSVAGGKLVIGSYSERITFSVITLVKSIDIILGLPWIIKHEAELKFNYTNGEVQLTRDGLVHTFVRLIDEVEQH
jgi:hypothetical protein